MLSCSIMLLRLLLRTICFALCSGDVSGSLSAMFQPTVMYTSSHSAVIRWGILQPTQEKDGYVIEYGQNWHNSKTFQVSKSSTAAMISNLEPDTLYNIRVRVPDVGGTHPGPSISFRTRPVVSVRIGVPPNIAVVPLPLFKLLVTWDLPYRARASDVVHYSLVFAPVYSPFLRKTSLLLPGHYKSFTLTYLRPNTLYKVKIAALLKSRKGPYTSWVIAQTVGQVQLDNAGQPTTKKRYHHPTGKLGITTTSPSEYSTTTTTRPGLQLSTDIREHSTQSSTQAKGDTILAVTTGKTAESTTLAVTVPSTAAIQNTTTTTTERSERERDGTTQQTIAPTPQSTTTTTTTTTKPSKHEINGTTPLTGQQTTPPPTTVPSKHERDGTTQQTTAPTPQSTTTTTTVPSKHEINGTTPLTGQQTTPPPTTVPSKHERDGTTQHTTATTPQSTTTTTTVPSKHERDGTTQQPSQQTIAPTPQRMTTVNQKSTSTTLTPSPSQHTEQVNETIAQLTTEGTKAQSTVELQTAASPPLLPSKTTRKHKTRPTVTSSLQTTEQTKLSTEQTINRITQPNTERQTTKQATERTTHERLEQPTTKPNAKQTTQKPTSRYVRTNRAVSGTKDILQPTTAPSVSAVTEKQVTDSQLFSSTPSSRQREIIITPSSSTMRNLVITGTLPMTTAQGTCERLEPSMCSDMGYQTTKMTSKEGQNKMMDHVRSMWSDLTPLCQSHGKLKQFLCAASFPYCSQDLGGPFLPCRSMCMSTKRSCNMNGEDWPAEFNCSKFPGVGESAICISYGHESEAPTTATIQVTHRSPVPPSDDPASESTTSALPTESSTSLATTNPTTVKPKPLPSHCELLYLKACDNIGYQAVQFPNYFNQTHQNDAGVKISRYWPLIEVNCSPFFRLFLCSLYTPICTSKTTKRNMLPCRSLCQQVTNDCSYLMNAYEFEWPEGITCEDFPDVNDGTCLSQRYFTSQEHENVLPFAPTTSKESQVTINRSSTKAILLTLPGAISVEQEMTTVESSPSAAKPTSVAIESAKPTTPTQPKTGKNTKVIHNEQLEDSTEAIVQRNEEDLISSVQPTTGASVNAVYDQLTSTKSSSISSSTSPVTISPPSGCEGLYLKICQGVGYSFTQFPNFFNHKHQNDAGRQVHRYWPIVETNCSPKLQLFLCSLYAPMCTKTFSNARELTGSNMLPCRSICYQVKRECRTKMKLYGLQWPQGVECTKFPMDDEKTCIYGKTNDTDSKGLFKITKAKKGPPEIPSTPLPGTTKCQPLPTDHPCKNHYEMASVSNASESFESTKKLIEDRTSKIKDLASKKCLKNLEMFLCSVNTPRCSNGTMFGPCRSQCKTTVRRCGVALLEKINFEIVDLKGCRRFPMTRCTENKRRSRKPKSKSVESL